MTYFSVSNQIIQIKQRIFNVFWVLCCFVFVGVNGERCHALKSMGFAVFGFWIIILTSKWNSCLCIWEDYDFELNVEIIWGALQMHTVVIGYILYFTLQIKNLVNHTCGWLSYQTFQILSLRHGIAAHLNLRTPVSLWAEMPQSLFSHMLNSLHGGN